MLNFQISSVVHKGDCGLQMAWKIQMLPFFKKGPQNRIEKWYFYYSELWSVLKITHPSCTDGCNLPVLWPQEQIPVSVTNNTLLFTLNMILRKNLLKGLLLAAAASHTAEHQEDVLVGCLHLGIRGAFLIRGKWRVEDGGPWRTGFKMNLKTPLRGAWKDHFWAVCLV